MVNPLMYLDVVLVLVLVSSGRSACTGPDHGSAWFDHLSGPPCHIILKWAIPVLPLSPGCGVPHGEAGRLTVE